MVDLWSFDYHPVLVHLFEKKGDRLVFVMVLLGLSEFCLYSTVFIMS